MTKFAYSALAFVILSAGSAQANVETVHLIGEWGNTIAYRVSVPNAYAGSTHDWPVLVHMHGNGGQGSNGNPKGPPGSNLWKEQIIMIAPQCLSGKTWWGGGMRNAALAVINREKGLLRIDEDRVYITGQSMGGYASYLMTEDNPNYFAAVVPISGGWGPYKTVAIPADLSPWTHLPYRHFHGKNDSTVPVGEGRAARDTLRAAGIYMRYTEYNAGHSVRHFPYRNQAFYDWLLAQTRNTPHNYELGLADTALPGNDHAQGYFESGTAHTIGARAGDSAGGEVFRGWTSAAGTVYTDTGNDPVSTTGPGTDVGSIADANALSTTFTMPDNDVVVTANYLRALENLEASFDAGTSVFAHANLNATDSNFDVTIYWGTTDGGTDPAAWSNQAIVGSWSNTSLGVDHQLTLSPGVTYYYTFRATNGGEDIWGGASVRVSLSDFSDADMLAFDWNGHTGVIEEGSLTVEMRVPEGTNLVSGVKPVYTVSEGATGDPASGAAADFSNSETTPVEYTVTALNGTTQKVYGVSVMADLPASGTILTEPSGLSPGDRYRLVFVTSAETYSGGTNHGSNPPWFQGAADYNAFATEAATAVTALNNLGTTWTAIVSSSNPEVGASFDARDNTNTNPTVETGVPIYTLGDLIVSDDNADLWDGTIANPINVTELGTLPALQHDDLLRVWTGTNSNGSSAGNRSLIGQNGGWVGNGRADATTDAWVEGNFSNIIHTHDQPIYVISGILTAVGGGDSFEAWAAISAGGQGSDLDFNNNGMPNGIEFFMGGTESDPATVPALSESGGTWSWTIPYDASATGVTWFFQVSEDLVTWFDYKEGDGEVSVESGPDRIVITLPPSATGGKFVRLVVVTS